MDKELMALIRRLRVQVDILRSPELPIGGCAKAISDIADALAAQADAQPEPVALTVAEAANRIRRGDHSAVNYNKVFGELTTAFTAAPPSGPTSFTIMEVGTAPQPAQPDVARLWALEQAYRRSPGSYVADMCDELAATLTELGIKP